MSQSPTSTLGGYSIRLAMRHLVFGLMHPLTAMREALDAGISERGRIALAIAASFIIIAANIRLWRVFAEAALDSETQGIYVFGMAIILLFAAIFLPILLYTIHFIFIFLLLRIGYSSTKSAADIRSAVAIGGWMSAIPTVIASAVAAMLLPRSMIDADSPSVYGSIEPAVLLPYFATCLIALRLTPLQSLATATVSIVGGELILQGLFKLVSDAIDASA